MKSKDLQKIVLPKCQNGDTPTEIHCNLNSGISLRTIKRWCQMICQSSSIALSTPLDCPRFVRTKSNVQEVWAVNRADADRKSDIQQGQKSPQKVMIWLSVTPLVILDDGTVGHTIYIKKSASRCIEIRE